MDSLAYAVLQASAKESSQTYPPTATEEDAKQMRLKLDRMDLFALRSGVVEPARSGSPRTMLPAMWDS
jgi:hypothetical protein